MERKSSLGKHAGSDDQPYGKAYTKVPSHIGCIPIPPFPQSNMIFEEDKTDSKTESLYSKTKQYLKWVKCSYENIIPCRRLDYPVARSDCTAPELEIRLYCLTTINFFRTGSHPCQQSILAYYKHRSRSNAEIRKKLSSMIWTGRREFDSHHCQSYITSDYRRLWAETRSRCQTASLQYAQAHSDELASVFVEILGDVSPGEAHPRRCQHLRRKQIYKLPRYGRCRRHEL